MQGTCQHRPGKLSPFLAGNGDLARVENPAEKAGRLGEKGQAIVPDHCVLDHHQYIIEEPVHRGPKGNLFGASISCRSDSLPYPTNLRERLCARTRCQDHSHAPPFSRC